MTDKLTEEEMLAIEQDMAQDLRDHTVPLREATKAASDRLGYDGVIIESLTLLALRQRREECEALKVENEKLKDAATIPR